MNNYPEYVEIEGKQYKINTDFRVAIRCNEIAEDDSIGNFERAIAIIYLLYGDEGLNAIHHHEKLLKLGQKYLACGKELNIKNDEQPDMDFVEDMDYIEASFMSDYHIDLTDTKMHWWKFFNLISGLSNSDMGNCCVLNRVRNLRNYDTKEIKDRKEREKIEKAKQQVALKKYSKKKEHTEEQKKNAQKILDMFNL